MIRTILVVRGLAIVAIALLPWISGFSGPDEPSVAGPVAATPEYGEICHGYHGERQYLTVKLPADLEALAMVHCPPDPEPQLAA